MSTRKQNNLQQHQRGEIRLEHRVVDYSFSGPLPPPESLARYNEVLPGAADRILSMAETQQHHRQELESNVIESNVKAQRLGVHFGFVIAMTAIVGGIYLAAIGRPASGLTSIIAALAALVGTFVYGKRKQSKDLNDKKPS